MILFNAESHFTDLLTKVYFCKVRNSYIARFVSAHTAYMEVVVVQGSYMVYVQSLLFSRAPKNLKGGFKLYRSAFGQWLDPLTSYPSSPSPK